MKLCERGRSCACVWELCVTQSLVQVCLVKSNPGIVYNHSFFQHVHNMTNSESQQCVCAGVVSDGVCVGVFYQPGH